MSEAILTATTNLPSTKNDVTDGSAEDTACIYHTDSEDRSSQSDIPLTTHRKQKEMNMNCFHLFLRRH
jgi:hypothetical protein